MRRIFRPICLLLLAFSILEISARMIFRLDPKFWWANDSSAQRLLWARGHRDGTFIYWCDHPDAQRGWTLAPSIHGGRLFDKPVNSNSYGFRGVKEFNLTKSPGRTRILVLGDSFAFGEEVGDEETYSARLGRLLPNTEVLNLGVHGYGHDQMLLYFLSVGVQFHPDIVLLGYLPMDVDRNALTFYNFAKPRYRLENGQLVLKNTPIPPPAAYLRRELFRLKILDLLMVTWDRTPWGQAARQKDAKSITPAILDELIRSIRGAGAVPVFIYCPAPPELVGLMKGQTSFPEEADFLAFCAGRGVHGFSVRPGFSKAVQNGTSLAVHNHWDPLEHKIAAEAIADDLVKHGLTPGPVSLQKN